ncbi:MAG: hypothetical protein KF841_13235 [Phycisphaerae bacterium]|nr:hypothetical protein [Phycisphaerae bacterium]
MPVTILSSAAGLFACLAIVGINVEPPPIDPAPTHIVAGRRFRIICDWKNQKAAAEALRVVEAVWPIVTESWDCDEGFAESSEPVTELDVYLYQTIAAYESADAARTGGRFRENLSFSHHQDRKARVALQPPCSDELLARSGLPVLTRTMLAHEAAHLAVYSLIPNHADHPEWMTEGFAAWAATEVLLADRSIDSVEADPFSATMLTRARGLANDKRWPSLKSIITGVRLPFKLQDRYAIYWQLYRFLNQPQYQMKLSEIHRHARRSPRSNRLTLELGDFATRQFGGLGGLKACDAEFRRFVMEARPRWWELTRSMEIRGDEWIQIAFPSTRASLQFDKPIQATSFRVTGSLEFLRNQVDHGESAIVFHGNPDASIEIRFSTDRSVQIASVDKPTGRIRILGQGRLENQAAGNHKPGPHRFSIDIGAGRVAIGVDGQPPLQADFPAGEASYFWGLIADRGTAVIWRNLGWSSGADAGK